MISLIKFDSVINQKSILTHYFYEQKWNMGELSKEDLQIYAKEYFHLAKRIPGIVSRVIDRAKERGSDLVSEIEQNMVEETEHVELWKRFAKSLDVSDAELEAYEPTAKVKAAVDSLEQIAGQSLEDGVAVMYAMELELPAVAQSKKDGLTKWYNLHSEDAHIYFDEHLKEADHFNLWRKVLVDEASAEKAINASLAAQHLVLDGVCDACGIEIKR